MSADLEEDIISRIFRIYNASRVRTGPTELELGFPFILPASCWHTYSVHIRPCSRGLERVGQQNKFPALWGFCAKRKLVKESF